MSEKKMCGRCHQLKDIDTEFEVGRRGVPRYNCNACVEKEKQLRFERSPAPLRRTGMGKSANNPFVWPEELTLWMRRHARRPARRGAWVEICGYPRAGIDDGEDVASRPVFKVVDYHFGHPMIA